LTARTATGEKFVCADDDRSALFRAVIGSSPVFGGYPLVMTNEEHVENTVQETGGDDESFDVFLPVSPAVDGEGATHVARMRGNEAGFVEVLAGFVATGSDLSAPLRSPVDEADLDRVKALLEGLGAARVESIERLDT
jgi:hypothetical protein